MSITCPFKVVSPFLVGHIHTFTLNIQAVGGQRGGEKKNMAQGSRMISFDALLFILEVDVFLKLACSFFFLGHDYSRRFQVTSSIMKAP